MNNNRVYDWILQTTFTVSTRQKSLECLMPYLAPLVCPGGEVIDLCCGSDPMSFWFDFGRERYGLISCFGNSISDFPLTDFARLVRPVAQALKPGGRFVLDYHDGVYHHLNGTARQEGTYQECPESKTFRFEKYQPEVGALVTTTQNETRGEEYQRKSYIYTPPVVQVVIGGALRLERHIVVAENHFLDIFMRK